ncbi:hypothetical protein B0H66DRAFT_537497 [Apodospora peruviana]|uniref:Uncharacterized protein n=1 Tax=Apodospora peruviana TaxID=516989 RepID=A0AAE0HYF6_9PEZI|nr:hypothetical protein B0H66DRAFT_537497 [Apodospora peruviana]
MGEACGGLLRVNPVQCIPYYHISNEIKQGWHPKPSSEKIDRVLRPYQKYHERALDQQYQEMSKSIEFGVEVKPNGELNDASLYNFDDGDWTSILLRIPELCGVNQMLDESNHHHHRYPIDTVLDKDEQQDMGENCVVTMLYVIDETEIRERMAKIMWLDAHGRCLWWNRIQQIGMTDFTGA